MRLRAHAGALQRRLNTAAMPLPVGPERPDSPTAWLQGKMTLARKAANGWKRSFDEPIPLPRGGQLITLEGRRQVHHQAPEGRA